MMQSAILNVSGVKLDRKNQGDTTIEEQDANLERLGLMFKWTRYREMDDGGASRRHGVTGGGYISRRRDSILVIR